MTRIPGLAVLLLALSWLACRSAAPDPVPVEAPTRPAADAGDDRSPDERDLPPPPANDLDEAITPLAYDVEFAIDPRRTTYTGRVAIRLTIAQPVMTIWLHAEDLDIEQATLTLGDGRAIELATPPRRARTDLIGFDVDEPVPAGTATLDIGFRGRMGTRVGVFRQTRDGRHYVFTDFQPIDARRAFPCFDQPRFKTPWTISLVIPDGLRAFSNMPRRASEDAGSGSRRVRFKTTRLLPTYLVAFAVGPFDVVDVRPRKPVPMRIIVPKGERDAARVAAAMAPPLLRIVADYFGTEVPFPKLDVIAVPEFNGAMENPGLITVAASILLTPGDTAPIPQERLLAKVYAHEFAHLWFGDLVTPRDWTELWLNEGFATWLADKALIAYRSNYVQHVAQVVDKTAAMAVDHHRGARAIRKVGRARAELRSAFDPLSYRKGGALVAMFEAFLSERVFRRAVRNYISFNSDGGVTTRSFVGALGRAAGRDLEAAFSTFLDQSGVPLVRVEVTCADGRASATLQQRPYVLLADRDAATRGDGPARWHIPMCLRHGDAGGEHRTCVMLDRPTRSVALAGDRCPAWVVPNADATGYYRYVMPQPAMQALARAPLSDREGTDLAHNIVALLYSGDVELGDGLAMLQDIGKSPSRHIAEVIIDVLATIHDHMVTGKQRARLRDLIRRLYSARVRALGFAPAPGESQEKALLRPRLIEFVGRYGDDPWVIRTAQRTVQKWLRQGLPTGDAAAAAVLKVAAHRGDAALYDQLDDELRKRVNQRDTAAQQVLYSALAVFRDTDLVDRSLALVANPAMPGRPFFLRELLFSDAARDPALAYIDDSTALKERDPARRYLLLAPLFGPTPCDAEGLERVRKLAGRAHLRTRAVTDRIAELTREARACSAFRRAHRDAARRVFR